MSCLLAQTRNIVQQRFLWLLCFLNLFERSHSIRFFPCLCPSLVFPVLDALIPACSSDCQAPNDLLTATSSLAFKEGHLRCSLTYPEAQPHSARQDHKRDKPEERDTLPASNCSSVGAFPSPPKSNKDRGCFEPSFSSTSQNMRNGEDSWKPSRQRICAQELEEYDGYGTFFESIHDGFDTTDDESAVMRCVNILEAVLAREKISQQVCLPQLPPLS